MQTRIIRQISAITAELWNGLEGGINNPFIRHEFLAGLEENNCVGEKWGWHPRHLLLEDENGILLGAMPLYLKDNSYGEFVFDWSWAEAYQRAGLRYYPKLVSSSPYSPVTGPRLLVAAGADRAEVKRHLGRAVLDYAQSEGVSSLHILFTDEEDTAMLESSQMMRRTGTQFHWFNRDYHDFDDYLTGFTSSKRKKLKRERRRVAEQGIEIEILDGHQASAEQWQQFTRFYLATFEKHWGYATLNEGFFKHLGQSMPDNIMLVMAKHQGEYVAAALSLRSHDTLYGRHWGCLEEYHSLHFELCYYQGIEYCITHGLSRFEPGAQGEHKVGRGFEPMPTWSAHWLADPRFTAAVKDYLAHEHGAMQEYMDELKGHLPYKHDDR
jgi:predicted N-acyltransferase